MGNICRSPLGEGVFRHAAIQRGLVEGKDFICSSAGTIGYHVGNPPDSRSQNIALSVGIDISSQRSQKVKSQDFEAYDYILAMDNENYKNLTNLCPHQHLSKISLLLDFSTNLKIREVSDPYYGGSEGFKKCLELVQGGVNGLLEEIISIHFSSKTETT